MLDGVWRGSSPFPLFPVENSTSHTNSALVVDTQKTAVAPKAIKKPKKSKDKNDKSKSKSNSGDDPAALLAGRKRGRSQLSPEGFEESDGEAEGTGDEAEEEEEDEESRLKAAEEEEAKLRRAEKKKQKLKALKV